MYVFIDWNSFSGEQCSPYAFCLCKGRNDVCKELYCILAHVHFINKFKEEYRGGSRKLGGVFPL